MSHSKFSCRFPKFFAIIVVLVGCTVRTHEGDAPQTWVIESLYEELGHDTILDDEGMTFHNYFSAIVLKRDDEKLRLLYENQLPASFDFEPNDTVLVDGVDKARYDEHWNGYWLHDVEVRRPSQW